MHDPARGFDQFRQCLPRLLEMRPNCLVVLAWLDIAQTGQKNGSSPAPAECTDTGKAMRRAVDILGIDQSFRSRVHLLGARSLKEYRAMLQHSTAHVYLAAPHVFSTGLLEAMACGVPTVAARVGAYETLIRDGETGSLVPRDDVDALTAALASWLDDDSARAAAGRAARAHVEANHAIECEARAITEVYRKLLA